MTRRTIVLAATGALGLGALVPLTAARAYPPATRLAVSAVNGATPTSFTVSVTNGLPGCPVKVDVRDQTLKGTIGADGTASFAVTLGSRPGRYTVKAVTQNCDAAERAANTQVVVARPTDRKVSGSSTARVNRSFEVKATGWVPNSTITFTTTLAGGQQFQETVHTNSRGEARDRVRFTSAGTGTVTVSQGSESRSFPVAVRR